MAEFTKVDGKDVGDIKVYTLSTCGWCKKTKTFFNDNDIKYAYIDMDKLEGNETDVIRKEQMKFNRSGSFPTIVVNDKDCIVGYDEDALRALIGE